jgi:hypothetical protein
MRKRPKIILSVVGIAAVALIAGVWNYRKTYPFGQSHCCILGMASSLERFAGDHNGRYPDGESSAEASLSLLYRSGESDPYTLRGMTIPEKTTRTILEGGGLLSPETCGWHYTPGLTKADNPKLALLWCKEPLGHNGQRTKGGGRQVVFVGGMVEWVSETNWSNFLIEQKRLLAERSPRAVAGKPTVLVTAAVELPDGSRVGKLNSTYIVTESSSGPGFSSSGSSSDDLDIVWFHPEFQEGQITRTLSFSNLVSDPVTVRFTNGIPDVTNVVFTMKQKR